MKKLIFIALLSLSLPVANCVYGQTQNIDSLMNVLETLTLTNEEKLALYVNIGDFYEKNNYDSCIKYSERGLLLAEKTNSKSQIAMFNKILGTVFYHIGSYDSSYVYLNKCLEWAIKLKDKRMEIAAYNQMGNMFSLKQEYQTAVDNYMKSLALNDSINRLYATTTLNLGILHRILHHWDIAENYINEALTIAKELNLEDIEMGASHALGSVFLDLNEIEKAGEFYKKSLELSRKLGDKRYERISNTSLATYYLIMNDYDEAFNYINESLRIAEETGAGIIAEYIKMASIYKSKKQYDACEESALKAWAIDSTSISEGSYAAYYLAVSNIHLGNKQKAEYFLEQFQSIVFHGNNEQMGEALANMQVKYETEKKEMRIASLEKERQMYVLLGVSGVFLAASLGIVLALTIRNARRKRRLIATEALQEGEIGERTRISKDLHDRLGGSLSAVKIGLKNEESLQVINDKIDTCMKELREIINNIIPISLQKFGMKGALEDFSADFSNLHFHFFGENGRINPNQEYAVYCCARELVNNALKHSGASNINLQLVQNKKYVTLTVQDDGCGFDEKNVQKGYGLENIRNRVTTCRGKLDITSAQGKGTETFIELKL